MIEVQRFVGISETKGGQGGGKGMGKEIKRGSEYSQDVEQAVSSNPCVLDKL